MNSSENMNIFRKIPRSLNQKVVILLVIFVSGILINVLYYDSNNSIFNKIHLSFDPSTGKYRESLFEINHDPKNLNHTQLDLTFKTVSDSPNNYNVRVQKSSTSKYINEIKATTSRVEEEVMKCKLPRLKPFDPSILTLLVPPDEIFCHENPHFPLIFESDLNSSIILLRTPEDDLGFDLSNCCYSNYVREPDTNEPFEHSYGLAEACIEINSTVTEIPQDFEHIMVFCLNETTDSLSAVDAFTFVRKKKEVEERLGIVEKSGRIDLDYVTSDQYNVVLMGIDGVSHMNFLRTMPNSLKFLLKNLSAIEMEGGAKVGENTFPNMVPALTGWTAEELKRECWKHKDDYFDNCNFIWDTFADYGYYTSYAEDAPTISTFSYLKNGFKESPVDYFLQPLLLAGERHLGHSRFLNAEICYGPRHSFQIMLNYMAQMARFMKSEKKPYFQYLWNNPLFHDALEMAASGDPYLTNALEFMSLEGHLNNTILIIMSDHGLRWGEIRSTYQGKVEERMPFLYFVFPPSFKEKYSKGIENLIKNRNRLTTHFDLHETLKDLADLRRIKPEALKEKEEILLKRKSNLPRGISLFLPIPKGRSCSDAGIDRLWCICDSKEEVNVKSKKIVAASNFILNSINYMVSEYNGCAYLNMTKIVNAQKILLDQEMFKDYDYEEDDTTTKKSKIKKKRPTKTKRPVLVDEIYEITIKTQPGNGTFEGTILHLSNNKWKLEEIVRASLYGNQSWCVDDSKMKNFCYCL